MNNEGCSPWLLAVIALLLLSGPLSAAAPTAERVIEQVSQLQQAGVIAADAKLNIQVKQGNRASFQGLNHQLKQAWEEATGVLLNIELMPQGPAQGSLQAGSNLDLVVARNHEYPDLYDQGLILALDPLLEDLGFNLEDDQDFFLLAKQSQIQSGETLAVPADGDLLLMFLRQDLLDDPEEQAAFAQAYGYPLQAPKTWQEYQDQLAFFHRPEQGLYGNVELRDPSLAWMYWLPRYAAYLYPERPFDEQGWVWDQAAARAATQSYLATLNTAPGWINQPGTNYDLALPYFIQGKAYALPITIAGAKLFNRSGSFIKGRYSVHPLPGVQQQQTSARFTSLAFGNNLVIPARSEQPLLALLYALWLTSAEVSSQAVSHPGSFVDPFRYSHLNNPAIRSVYGSAPLAALQASLPLALPAGTGLAGNDAQLQGLNDLLGQAGRQELDLETLLEKMRERL